MGPGRDSGSAKRKQANRSEILKFEFRDVFGRAMCKIIGESVFKSLNFNNIDRIHTGNM